MSNIQAIADSQDWTDATLLTLLNQFFDQNADIEKVICEYLESCCASEDEEETQYCQNCGNPILEEDYTDENHTDEICQDCIDEDANDDPDDEPGESVESVAARASKLSRAGCTGILESVGIAVSSTDTDEELREAVTVNVLDNTIDWYCFDVLCGEEGIDA